MLSADLKSVLILSTTQPTPRPAALVVLWAELLELARSQPNLLRAVSHQATLSPHWGHRPMTARAGFLAGTALIGAFLLIGLLAFQSYFAHSCPCGFKYDAFTGGCIVDIHASPCGQGGGPPGVG